jgi:cell wall-associated NlpC family hydrolase
MPGTAKGYHIDPHNPMQSIDAQGRMMSKLLKSYNGNESLALAAYNAGAGAVAKAGGKVPHYAETERYIKNVLGFEKNYPGLAAGKWGSVAGLKLPSGQDATTPAPSVPAMAPQLAPTGTARGGEAQPSPPPQISVDGLLQAAKQHLGVPTPTNPLLDFLKQNQPQALGPQVEPLKLPSGKTAQTTMDKKLPKVNSGIVGAAEKFLGTPYLWGGTTAKGLDCSGLVQLAVKNATGQVIPRVASAQYAASTKVNLKNMQPGDIIAFGSPTNVHHIGIYVGNGRFINAPHTGTKVRIDSLAGRNDVVGAGRFPAK